MNKEGKIYSAFLFREENNTSISGVYKILVIDEKGFTHNQRFVKTRE